MGYLLQKSGSGDIELIRSSRLGYHINSLIAGTNGDGEIAGRELSIARSTIGPICLAILNSLHGNITVIGKSHTGNGILSPSLDSSNGRLSGVGRDRDVSRDGSIQSSHYSITISSSLIGENLQASIVIIAGNTQTCDGGILLVADVVQGGQQSILVGIGLISIVSALAATRASPLAFRAAFVSP